MHLFNAEAGAATFKKKIEKEKNDMCNIPIVLYIFSRIIH
jgi:hypothetical protein